MLLRDRRESVTRVLEIGIGTPETMPHVKDYKAGSSLRMWRDYFPEAFVYGIDIDKNAIAEAEGPRIHTSDSLPHQGGFDLVIDDGSHKPEDQLENFQKYYSQLFQGGLYIIEDVERYVLEQNLLSPHLPEHTVIQHHHGKEVGRCILIRG